MMIVIRINRDILLDELLNIHQELVLFRAAVGNGGSSGSCTTGAANAVDVGFGFIGEVEVDHEGHIFHVDSACGDVGSDEDGEGSFFKFLKGAFALWLRAVSVNCLGGKSRGVNPATKFIGSVLRLGENVGETFVPFFFEVFGKEFLLVFAVHKTNALVHFFGGGCFGSDGNRSWFVEDAPGELIDRWRKRGREEEGLTLAWKGCDDAFDIAEESHVEHAVDFIKDEEFDAGEIDISLIHVVEKTTGASNENIDAVANGTNLWVFTNATEDQSFAEIDMAPVGLEAGGNLGGEFPGRGKNEDTGRAAFGAAGIFVKGIEYGQREGCCFSGAGLGDAQEVLTFEQGWDGLCLNGGGRNVVLFLEGTLNGSRERDLPECCRGHVILRGGVAWKGHPAGVRRGF